jgi:hypothetical protein
MQEREEQTVTVDDERELANGQDESVGDEFDAVAADELVDGEGEQDGEAEGLPQLQAEFRRLAGPLGAFAKIRPTDPKSLERLDAALKRLPSGESLGEAVEGLRERTAQYLHVARRERIAAFHPIEADWVRGARESGKGLRERSSGWRVEMLELQLQREQARARFFFNREALTPWSPIGSPDDLAALEERARKLLDGIAFPDAMLTEVFWDAYEQERAARQRVGKGRAETIPLPDFYRGVRVALVRHELAGQGPEKKLRWAELPRWAFLYNLDRYRALGPAVPEGRRLGLQTGSQQESRQFGMVVNGLDAAQDYRTMCFVVPFSAGRGGS